MANCSVLWDSFSGSIPDSLMHFFIFYCCAICVVGIFCNVVVLCCVVECSRTSPSVKVLLCALFSCTLFMCLLVMPFMVHLSISKLRCDGKLSLWLVRVCLMFYIVLTEMELLYIFLMAFIRALAVWSLQRHQLKMNKSVSMVVAVVLYTLLCTLAMLVPYWVDQLENPTGKIVSRVFSVVFRVNIILPMALTLAAYSSMIFAVRRNKHRLATSQHKAGAGQVMDQATRAMLAVFISSLLLGLPHSIYHTIPRDPQVFDYVIVHCVFFTHLFVDPLVFVCFNLHHRRQVLHTLNSFLCWVSRRLFAPMQAVSTLALQVTPSTSSEGNRNGQVQEQSA